MYCIISRCLIIIGNKKTKQVFVIKNAVNGGIDLNKSLDNFSEKTPLYFAKKYCSSETLEKYFGNETEKSE